jgi:hypothetical protein
LKVQRHEQAAADAIHALQLLDVQTESGTHSSNIGRAYLALALSLKAQGKSSESQDAVHHALQHLQDTLGPAHPDTRTAHDMDVSFVPGD